MCQLGSRCLCLRLLCAYLFEHNILCYYKLVWKLEKLHAIILTSDSVARQ